MNWAFIIYTFCDALWRGGRQTGTDLVDRALDGTSWTQSLIIPPTVTHSPRLTCHHGHVFMVSNVHGWSGSVHFFKEDKGHPTSFDEFSVTF